MDTKRKIKTFEHYLTDEILMSDVASGYNVEIDNILKKKYNEIYFNGLLMLDVADNYLNEDNSLEDFVLKASTNNWESDPKVFYDSFMSSDKIGFLTPYSVDDLKEFSLYKVKDYKIGFAVKKDGDIILVHNNEPKIKNIGRFLLKKAIEKGGKKLDHFDGFLTGFYRSIGFNLQGNDKFADEYAPEKWEYKKVDINNPKLSIYASELEVNKLEFKLAEGRYSIGKPDVVYRGL
jgi:hypothetical protein